MRFTFKFPDIGEGITEGKILQWYIDKGQSIKSGDALVKMETDKVVTDIPSPKAGTVAAIYGNVGDIINVGNVLVEIEIEGVSPEQSKKIAKEVPQVQTSQPIEEKSFGVVGTLEIAGEGAYLPASGEGMVVEPSLGGKEEKPPEVSATGGTQTIPPEVGGTTEQTRFEKSATAVRATLATPVARAMAKDLKVNIDEVAGTGPGGRVMKQDIQSYFDGKSRPVLSPKELPPKDGATLGGTGGGSNPRFENRATVEVVPLTMIRKTIAKNMARSKQNAAHMTVIDEIEVNDLFQERLLHKEEFQKKGSKLTFLPFIMKAVVDALKDHPTINAELDMEHDQMLLKHYYNIGIAMDTPEGLIVPVVRDVDKKSIYEIANDLLTLEGKASERKLTLDDLKDGTFTITNYGAIGGMYGVPIINYPQVGILGVGRIQQKPIVKDNQVVIANMMALSFVCDHRLVDGAEAARFLKQVMDYLHDPGSLLLY
jgi:pyruvate dehydrogenase E2 component (dihydrolipoamide acetyltransferase)